MHLKIYYKLCCLYITYWDSDTVNYDDPGYLARSLLLIILIWFVPEYVYLLVFCAVFAPRSYALLISKIKT